MAVKRISQISINDYPEHLNPFYEDDNHKNIRFWNITKRIGRSHSFSFSGINEGFKELRKSFRLKSRSKKNPESKFSSSPVELRKPLDFSSRFDENGFVIPVSERYIYQGSVTPIPRTKYSCEFQRVNSGYEILSNRLHLNTKSHSMVTSTPKKYSDYSTTNCQQFVVNSYQDTTLNSEQNYINPFDDEDLTRSQDSSTKHTENNNGLYGSLVRKKRRAPLPPFQSSSNSSSPVLLRRNDDNGIETSSNDIGSKYAVFLHTSEDDLVTSSIRTKCLNAPIESHRNNDENTFSDYIENDSKTPCIKPDDEQQRCFDDSKERTIPKQNDLDTIKDIIEQTLNLTKNDEEFIESLDLRDLEIEQTCAATTTTTITLIEEKDSMKRKETIPSNQKDLLVSDKQVVEIKENNLEMKSQKSLNDSEKNFSQDNNGTVERTQTKIEEDNVHSKPNDNNNDSPRRHIVEGGNDYKILVYKQVDDIITMESNEIKFIDETDNLLLEKTPGKIQVVEIENTIESKDKKQNIASVQVSTCHDDVSVNKCVDDCEKKIESKSPSKNLTFNNNNNNNNVWVDDSYNNNNIFKYDMKNKRGSFDSKINENSSIKKHRSLFDYSDVDVTSPNPIPKPRRSGLTHSLSQK